MALSDRLNYAINNPQQRRCKLMLVLYSDLISKEDRETFIGLLNVPEGTPGRITNVVLANVLREEGFDISDSAVNRHRRKSCNCSRSLGE